MRVQSGIIVSLVGLGLEVLHNAAHLLAEACKRAFLVRIQIDSRDDAFRWLMHWLIHTSSVAKSRNLCVSSSLLAFGGDGYDEAEGECESQVRIQSCQGPPLAVCCCTCWRSARIFRLHFDVPHGGSVKDQVDLCVERLSLRLKASHRHLCSCSDAMMAHVHQVQSAGSAAGASCFPIMHQRSTLPLGRFGPAVTLHAFMQLHHDSWRQQLSSDLRMLAHMRVCRLYIRLHQAST